MCLCQTNLAPFFIFLFLISSLTFHANSHSSSRPRLYIESHCISFLSFSSSPDVFFVLFPCPPGTQAQQVFRNEPRNQTVRMGATAVLRCEVLRASGTVQWVKDGLLLGPQKSLPGFPRYSMIGNPKRGKWRCSQNM